MATSGSVDFSVNRNEIIQAAFEAAKIIGAGEQIDSDDFAVGTRELNMMVKQYQADADFSSGFKTWSRKRATLFLQKGQIEYDLGPNGDHWTGSFVRTTLSAAEAASATVIDVTSSAGMTAADAVGIVLDDNSLHWTTIVSVDSSTQITITTGIASAAASGNYVYAYTSKARRPVSIKTMSLRETDANSDTSDLIMGFLSLEAYESIPNKTSQGDPTAGYYEAQLDDGKLYVNREPENVNKQIRIVYLSPIEDFDAAADTPDYPQEWYSALVLELAERLCVFFQMPITAELHQKRNEAVAIAQNLNPRTTTIFFEPGREEEYADSPRFS